MKPSVRVLAPFVALGLLMACGEDGAPSGADVGSGSTTVAGATVPSGDGTATTVAADDAGGAAGTGDVVDDAAARADTRAAELAEALRSNGLSSLASAVESVDITQLVDSDEFTLFAPDDEAFLSLEAEQTADLLSDPARVLDVLRNHVVGERLTEADMVAAGTVETETGTVMAVSTEGDAVTVGDATIVEADIDVGGGVVQVVDQLLLP